MSTLSYYQFIKFCSVGAVAAFTHYVVLIMLLNLTNTSLAYGNLIAFVIAFWVSYFGHRIITFSAQDILHQQALPKFMLVSGLGFSFNEFFLLTSHHYLPNTNLSYLIILVIICTAIFTFILSKFFAFKFSG